MSQKNKKYTTKEIVVYSMIAATYVALTLLLGFMSFSGVQFRIAEMLVLLCFYNKRFMLPLSLGCFIANLLGFLLGMNIAVDIFFGTLATIIALYLITKSPNIYVASIWPVIVNGLIIGFELYAVLGLPLVLSMVQVAIGEFVCVSLLAVGVFKILSNNTKFIDLIENV